jgi:hypothetical protein
VSALAGFGAASSGSSAAGKGVCGRVRKPRVCVCGARRVPGVRPQRPSRDANATSRQWHVITAHGKAVAGSWRGDGGEARVCVCTVR